MLLKISRSAVKFINNSRLNETLFQFLLIFRKAAAGELQCSGLNEVYKQMHEIDVDKEGVKGAKHFFEAKVILNISALLCELLANLLPGMTWERFKRATDQKSDIMISNERRRREGRFGSG